MFRLLCVMNANTVLIKQLTIFSFENFQLHYLPVYKFFLQKQLIIHNLIGPHFGVLTLAHIRRSVFSLEL